MQDTGCRILRIKEALAEPLQEPDSGVGFQCSGTQFRLTPEHRTLNTPLAEPGSASGSMLYVLRVMLYVLHHRICGYAAKPIITAERMP
jgi:hypothetical protein